MTACETYWEAVSRNLIPVAVPIIQSGGFATGLAAQGMFPQTESARSLAFSTNPQDRARAGYFAIKATREMIVEQFEEIQPAS